MIPECMKVQPFLIFGKPDRIAKRAANKAVGSKVVKKLWFNESNGFSVRLIMDAPDFLRVIYLQI